MESWKMRVHGRPQPPFYFHREVGPPSLGDVNILIRQIELD